MNPATLLKLPPRHLGGVFLLLFGSFYPTAAQKAEAPGGVNTPMIWYSGGDMLTTIGNHRTIDLLEVKNELENREVNLKGPATAFLVLMRNGKGSGERFASLGHVTIYDDHLVMFKDTVAVEFKEGEPTILAIQVPRQDLYAWRSPQSIQIVSEGSFSVAEMILFSRTLGREELRKVNSYLALKYSITITENKDSDWRDYWTPTDDHYWDKQIDGLYDRRVMGLGRSDEQGFYQSQTVSNTGREIWFSLNQMEERGKMPKVHMEDGSYIVFSERDSLLFKSGACSGGPSGTLNPLEQWKFRMRDWQSKEESLWIQVNMPEGVGAADSLFLFNGQQKQYLPVEAQLDERWLYRVRLQELNGQGHYFFVTGSRLECLEELIEVVDDQLIVRNPESDIWGVEIRSMEDGLTASTVVHEPVFSGTLEPGQYFVRVLNEEGEEQLARVVNLGSGSTQPDEQTKNPDITMYPNPVESGRTSNLRIADLGGRQQVQVLVADATGRVVVKKTVDYQSVIEVPVVLQAPGLYHVIVRQGDWAYSLKHIVSTSR